MIPLEKIDERLSLVAGNIQFLYQDHYSLMQAGSNWHAVAMAIFALEELVKYFILKREKDSAIQAKMTSIQVDERLFGRGRNSHKYKLEIARKERLIPLDAWTINTARFDRAYFDSAFFDTEDVVISAALRTRNTFVDWIDGKWEHGTAVETLRLKFR